jgi:hypothetical protein
MREAWGAADEGARDTRKHDGSARALAGAGGTGGRGSSRAQRGGFGATSRRWLVGTDRSYWPADLGLMSSRSKPGCHTSAMARRGLLGDAAFGGTTPDTVSPDARPDPGT